MHKLHELLGKNCSNFAALHCTSLSFLEKMISQNGISNGGNFDNFFYVLIEQHKKGVNILESATYYAHTNAIKDLLFTLHPEFLQIMKRNHVDPYLFSASLESLGWNADSIPTGLESFSAKEIALMRSAIDQAKLEDRRGVLIYFSPKLLEDFSLEDITDTGQANVLLTSPITLNHVCSIQLLGEFEKRIYENSSLFRSK